jgi:hypothetical protein
LFAGAGIVAGPQSCSSHNWFNTLNAGGALGCSQPSFADISGTIAATQLIPPTGSTLGGVQSKDCSSGGQFLQKINTDGSETCATPTGGGNVNGPVSSTSTAVPVYSNTAGNVLLNTGVTIDASNNIAGVNSMTGNVIATKAQQQSGSASTVAVTPSQQQSHDSAAKVHGLFTISGTTLSLAANSFNISPVGSGSSRTSTGQYIVGFITAFSNATYDCHTDATGSGAAAANLAVPGQVSYAAGQISVTVTAATAFSVAAPAAFSIVCYGRQ